MREKKLFFEAIEITDPARREQYLQKACQKNPKLKQRIDVLLAAAEGIGNFLEPADHCESVADLSAVGQQPDNPSKPAVSLDFLEPATDSKYRGALGHYDIIRVLGQGAFGIVLQASDRRLQRQVALKVLSPHLATTSPPRKRFLREARSCAAIKHPNVVHLYDVADTPIPFIAMELVEGQTLQDRIDEAGPLEIPEVIEIAKQLATGLEAAHSAGLIHRDIKPSNILIENRGRLRAVITDFGLARAVDDACLTQSGVLAGTPIFMSPEQAQGQPLDYRTDLFSLGSLLYVMITGRMPFRARSTVAVLQRVTHDTPRPISDLTPDCPEWLEKLVGQLLEKQKEQRIQTAREVRKRIELAQKKRYFKASPKKVSPDQKQSTGSNRGIIIASTLGVLALITLVIALANRHAKPESGDVQTAGETIAETASSVSPLLSDRSHLGSHWESLDANAPLPAIAPFGREEALSYQQQWADYLGVPVEFTDTLGIRFRLIPPGEFIMGTSDQGIQSRRHHVDHSDYWESSLLSEAPQHRVALTKPYYLAVTEVTQNLFESIMSLNPSRFKEGGSHEEFLAGVPTLQFPVEGASWDDIQTFLKRLHRRLGFRLRNQDRQFYRLPTEAEWEFACRAGTETDFWTGDSAESLENFENYENKFGRIADVGSFQSNPFGLYDMSGNVHEYVQDRWDSRHSIATEGNVTIDPEGATNDQLNQRVARGGDYWWWSYHSRSSYRIGIEAADRSSFTIGFRLAVDVDAYQAYGDTKRSPPLVSDFSEIHAATRAELQAWIQSLRRTYVPTRINLRWGSEEPLFDAVAINDTDRGFWRVNFFDNDYQAGQDYKRMNRTHNLFWKLVIPEANTPPHKCAGLKIWRQTVGDSATWNIGDQDLLEAVNTSKLDGWLPVSLAYTESGGGRNSAYVQHLLPGVGNQSLTGLSLEQFKNEAIAYRNRNWKLQFFQLAAGTSTPQFCVVFRENLFHRDWEMSFDLSQQQYEQALRKRRQSGWYPACVGSFLENGTVNYLVCWERLAPDESEAPQGKRNPGGFGGR